MTDGRSALWLAFVLVGGFCAYSWYWYIRSFIFYFRNDFDFSKDFGPKFRSEFAEHDQDWVKPREKFLIDWPIWVLATSFFTLVIVLALVGII